MSIGAGQRGAWRSLMRGTQRRRFLAAYGLSMWQDWDHTDFELESFFEVIEMKKKGGGNQKNIIVEATIIEVMTWSLA